YNEGIFGMEGSYAVYLNYMDVPGANYYKFNVTLNDTLLNTANDIIVVDDLLVDGNPIRIPIFTTEFQLGDSVEVELQSIDKNVFKFYQTMSAVASEAAGGPFSATPANPESNIKGGALGVFGAYTSSRKTIVIVEV